MNVCKEIKVASIINRSNNHIYHLSSMYIEPDIGFEDDSLERQFLSLLSHELISEEEASLYLYPKNFKELYEKDIPDNGEFFFENPFIITIHVHDLENSKGTGDTQVYYSISLKADKLINSGNELKLNLEKKYGDERIIFSGAKDKFLEYELFVYENK